MTLTINSKISCSACSDNGKVKGKRTSRSEYIFAIFPCRKN